MLVAASSPAHDIYSLAVADVTPLAADTTRPAINVPLSSEPSPAIALASEVTAPILAAASSEPATTATIAPLAPQGDALPKDGTAKDAIAKDPIAKDEAADPAPAANAPAAKGPVLAALEMPDESLPKPALKPAAPADHAAGPQTGEIYDAASSIEIHDECLVMDVCVDRYLWQLYQRTPKEDSIRESREKQVTIKKKGKLKTVTRSWTVVIDEDFGWKDPKAAKNADMSLADYVIGGVDRDFKLRLFSMLHAADQAGLSPGITSGFRDDYRQSIASGLKAASNRSYHGGSLRGGYGHGLAADIVSVKGATRAERLANSDVLWKWIDDHGREFGLGRPYLGRDPPHVAPNDGEEFARHRPGVKTRQAAN
ncbi:MAG TPA: peptidase M15 [Bradyrhizobium sp.]|uniref:peptidase M15 n=1 Tax=Bradyrhizobium sp. TaxID=376 RepID=UPI002D8036F0|nr:peptidase M15 [Bradyrhizobium sp.]HET7886899.1 peptidase M15 [Bradyrhizobium sp.]